MFSDSAMTGSRCRWRWRLGLQVGNLILMGLWLGQGMCAIDEYFYQDLPARLSVLQERITTAWHAENGYKSQNPTCQAALVL